MIYVAVLLLPFLSVLLLLVDRIEDRLFEPVAAKGRHAARKRHLRLLPGGRQDEEPARGRAAVEGDAPRERAA
ncbi:hypothetical protein AB0K80_28865 [Streptomyces sp. NPDC052682]|uniref:hypothetical protein n=1 Tax=Streptomyces sp. NPDC052682 TaxID=3154954 RepID=UPI003447DE68